MSKLPTTPKTPSAAPAPKPAAAPKASRGDKEMKGPLQNYYGKTIRLAAGAAKMVEVLKTLSEREAQVEGSKALPVVKDALRVVTGAHTSLNSMLDSWTKLHDLGWVPAKVSRGPAVGSELRLKDFAVTRFTKHGAYSKADVEKLRVVSVHGNQVKVSTLKGENLGVISTGWLHRESA